MSDVVQENFFCCLSFDCTAKLSLLMLIHSEHLYHLWSSMAAVRPLLLTSGKSPSIGASCPACFLLSGDRDLVLAEQCVFVASEELVLFILVVSHMFPKCKDRT